MKNTCRGCRKRHVGCHGKCKAYQAFHAENAARIKEHLDEMRATPDFQTFQRNTDSYLEQRQRVRKKIREGT